MNVNSAIRPLLHLFGLGGQVRCFQRTVTVTTISRSTSLSLASSGNRFYSNSTMVRAKKFIVKKTFHDLPKETDLELVEEDLPAIQEGECLVEALWLSVDPYMRAYTHRIREEHTMIGGQIAKIVQSRNKHYPEGKYVMGYFGWRTHTIFDGVAKDPEEQPYILPDFKDLPLSLGLGVLGMPGNTAYFGFLDICKPKSGETIVVTGAGGAVGSHVGQIAKIKGCTVIGITGSDAKCQWLKDELGFDHAINYRTQNLGIALAEAAPRGVDCYFDNIGGEISSVVIGKMNKFGRISVCGSISSYNTDFHNLPKATIIQPAMIANQLQMEGFVVHRWSNQWMEGINQNLEWIRSGQLKYKETVWEGFESMPKAFIGVLTGANVGKAIVKV